MKLSIIIALYNTEKYIEKCITSVLKSPLNRNDYEIIVINDGSTDDSQEIVERLKNEYSNILLINKENGGQSTARNLGFDIARGEYIYCLDSDDFINGIEFNEALEYAILANLDMLPIYFTTLNEDYKRVDQKLDNYEIISEPITGGEFMNTFVVSGTMWRYFYKTSLIKQHQLNLLEGIYHEDEEFIIRFLTYVKSIAYKRHNVYNYVQRHNSTVNNKNIEHRLRLIDDLITVAGSLNEHSKKIKVNSPEYIGIKKKNEQLLISILLRMKSDKLKINEVENIIENLEKKELYPFKIHHQSYKFKIAAFLFNLKIFRKLYFN